MNPFFLFFSNFKAALSSLVCFFVLANLMPLSGDDCDGDGILDIHEIHDGHDTDLNEDGYPDSCQDPTEFCTETSTCIPDVLFLCFEGQNLGPTLEVGTEFELLVKLDVQTPGINSWSFGVEHDRSKLEILNASPEGLKLPRFFFHETGLEISDPPRGFTSAVVLDIFPEPRLTLAPNQVHTLVRARYRVLEPISESQPALIKFSNTLMSKVTGFPPEVNFIIESDLGIVFPPEFAYPQALGFHSFPFCSYQIKTFFQRGDANNDSRVNLTDVIWILDKIFHGILLRVDCEDQYDVNDDGNLDFSDPINLLSWLFLGTSTPPPPFFECGLDSTADGLNCQSTCF